MAKKLGTVWELDPHTRQKHAILHRYLSAWLPIMTSWNGRVVYIDGFAGPGKYKGGEDGSPLIALMAARDHRVKMKAEIVFTFVEKDKKRYEHLRNVVKKIAHTLPKNFKWECIHGSFSGEMAILMNRLEEQKNRLAPSLVFIDPFGFAHTPFSTIERVMQNQRCEVLITFMYEEINRFLGHRDHEATYDALFGTEKWRDVLPIADPNERRRMIHDIYRDRLTQSAGIQYVRSFEMLNMRNRTDYFLFFGSNQLTGLEKMKQAMWRIDPAGTYQFSDYTDAKRTSNLFPDEPDYELLKTMILDEFRTQEVSVTELGNFVVVHTPFLRSHFKRSILTPMETSKELEVTWAKPARKKGTFPDGTKVRFV